MIKRQRVNRVVNEWYWNGFFANLGIGIGPRKPLRFQGGPRWLNEVAGIAYEAGWHYCTEVLDRHNDKPRHRLGSHVNRDIPGAVYADAYGAASK